MAEFNLNSFLKSYKPKSLEKSLQRYLKCEKLKDYVLLDKKNMHLLKISNTYIKYVNIDDNHDKNYEDHIKSGGMLIACGYYYSGKFINTVNFQKWTHLILKFSPSPIDGEIIESKTFVISLSKTYVFYKRYYNNQREFYNKLLEDLSK